MDLFMTPEKDSNMRLRQFAVVSAIAFVAACGTDKKELDTALVQAQTASAEKDSLLVEVLETTKLINDVNVELAKAKTVGVSPVVSSGDKAGMNAKAEERAMVLGKIREVVTRLEAAEANLERSKKRLGAMQSKDAKLLKQIDDYLGQVVALREQSEAQAALIEEQKGTITVLAAQLDSSRNENLTVTIERQQLADSVVTVTKKANTVYYLAGSKKELLEKGVVVNEGSKFLVFGGKQLAPARTLDTDNFTAIDKTVDSVLPLPPSTRGWKIVSRHGLENVAPETLKDGKIVTGNELRIMDVDGFWKSGPYLILVEN